MPIPIFLGTVKDPVTIVTIAGLYRHFFVQEQTSVFPLVASATELLNDLWSIRADLGTRSPLVPVEFYFLYLNPFDRDAMSEFTGMLANWGSIRIVAGSRRVETQWRTAWREFTQKDFSATNVASPEDIGRSLGVEDEAAVELLTVATDIQNGVYKHPAAEAAKAAALAESQIIAARAKALIESLAATGKHLTVRTGNEVSYVSRFGPQ